jgi:hypothetical protein
MQQNQNTPAAEQARNDFATCLSGIAVPPVTADKNQVQYTVEFTKQLLQRCQMREKTGGMVKPDELQGLGLAAKCVQDNLKIMAKNKAAAPVVKILSQKFGEAVNLIKAFGQRLQQAQKAQQEAQQQNGDGGKTASAVIAARTKAKIKEAEARQKMAHKDAAVKQELQHKALRTRADVAALDLKTASEIRRGGLFDEGEPDAGR